MASTGTGSRGNIPVSQSNGAETIPQPTKISSNRIVTSLFSRKNLIILFNIMYLNFVMFDLAILDNGIQ
jgi:hypothetical protein